MRDSDRRLIDWLLEEDILQLEEGLRREERTRAAVDAPMEVAPLDPPLAPAPTDADADAESDATIAGAKASKRSPLPLIGGLVVLLAAAAGGAWFFLGMGSPPQAPVAAPVPVPGAPAPVTATAASETTAPAETTASVAVTAAVPPEAASPVTAPAAAAPAPAAAAPPPPPPAPQARIFVVAGPLEQAGIPDGLRAMVDALDIREEVRTIPGQTHLIRSRGTVSAGEAAPVINELRAFGLAVARADDGHLQVGPVEDRSLADQAAALMLSFGIDAAIERRAVEEQIYYLHIGPIPDSEAAQALSTRVAEQLGVRTGLRREAAP